MAAFGVELLNPITPIVVVVARRETHYESVGTETVIGSAAMLPIITVDPYNARLNTVHIASEGNRDSDCKERRGYT